MSTVDCRAATATDAVAIAALHTASWRATYRGALRDAYLDGDVETERQAVWNARLTRPDPKQHVIVAEEDGVAGAACISRLVGFACAYGNGDVRWGTELDNLHVRSADQGRGIGARLLAAVARWNATIHPGVGLYLWVVDGNAGARRFYERLGAHDAEGDVWEPPDGSKVPVRRYVWSAAGVAELAALAFDPRKT